MLVAAVSLGGEQAFPAAGQASPQQVDLGLLAGLEHAEFGVHRGELGDDPAGQRCGTVGASIPGRPAVGAAGDLRFRVRVFPEDAQPDALALGEPSAPAWCRLVVEVPAFGFALKGFFVEIVLAHGGVSLVSGRPTGAERALAG